MSEGDFYRVDVNCYDVFVGEGKLNCIFVYFVECIYDKVIMILFCDMFSYVFRSYRKLIFFVYFDIFVKL